MANSDYSLGQIEFSSDVRSNSASWNYVAANSANEFSFKTISVSARDTTVPHQADIVADTTTDTFTLCAGPNIELIADSTTDTITISSRDIAGSGGSGVDAVSGGIALVGTTVHLADPETLTQIAEADAVAADRMLIWDESVSSWKYITIEDLQDEIDTGGGSGEANEDSFKTISVSARDTTVPHQADIVADTATDTLTLCAGPNIELIADSTTDTITISARDIAGSGGGVDAANGADNRVATFTDSDSLNGEANLTFTGSALTVAGTVSSQGMATLFGVHTTVHDYGTTANIDVDFDAASLQKVTLNGAPAIDTNAANKGAGKSIVIKILCDGSARAFTWNSSWIFIGEKPTSIAASKTALLSMTCFGTSESDVICSYAVQD